MVRLQKSKPFAAKLLLTCFFGGIPLFSADTVAKGTATPARVRAMIIYARSVNTHYPIPSSEVRNDIYEHVSGLFATISYDAHDLSFKETLNDGAYFVSEHSVQYYKENYDPTQHLHGFGMYNEEILYKVKAKYGSRYFHDVDLIIILGPDGGRNWYTRGVNATGYGMLGVTFKTGEKVFGKRQGEGGFTLEVGTGLGTPDSNDDRLSSIQELMWNISHEYGHWLGLGHRSPNLGIYSLMVKNLYTNERMPDYGPAPLDIFHIIQLGWLDENDPKRVKIISDTMTTAVTLNHIRSRDGIVLARIDIPDSREKFYTTYHRQDVNLFDGVYMGQGLLIWHRRDNLIDLECAGASDSTNFDHLDAGTHRGGLPTDFFNRARPEFTPNTNPNTDTGLTKRDTPTPTGISISDIQEQGGQIIFTVHFNK